MRPQRVVVLGAGVAGLAAAYRIREQAARRDLQLELTVLEASPTVGGKIDSLREEGFLCETGPNGFLDNEPATMRLVDDLGLRDVLQRSEDTARRRYLIRRGGLVEMHMNPVKFLRSPLLSLPAKLRMAREYWIKPKADDADESVGAFGRRRLGREFTEVMLDSMVSGIFAGDVDRLSVAAAFPKIVTLEHEYGGLFRGMAAKRRELRARKRKAAIERINAQAAAARAEADADASAHPEIAAVDAPVEGAVTNGVRPAESEASEGRAVEAGPGGVLHSFREGMGQPIRSLADSLDPGVLRLGTAVARVESTGPNAFRVHLADGDVIDADAVVVTLPAPAAAQVLRACADAASEALSEILVAGVHVVHLGLRRDQVRDPLAGFGALIPRREGIRTLGSIFSSSTFTGRAPKGYVLLTNMIGGRHDPDADRLDDGALLRQVLDDVGPLLGIDGDPVFSKVVRWARGIPQYEIGHLDRIERARQDVARLPGLHLGGNSVAGVSFNHCVLHAETLGVEVCDQLERAHASDGAPATHEGEAST